MTGEEKLLARVREICASLDGVSEGEAWRHPVFQANGKTFLAFEHKDGKPVLAFHLPPDEVDILTRDPRFLPTPYGRGEWVSLRLTGRTPWKLAAKLARRSRASVGSRRITRAR
ncbi:MAG TPA: MmcQ/YjbR family DNA-binding protein [Thermoanaerobaculia bacterium]|nr:MmcQ/YjbR family DNA-binding protein [Thermoanaerobaculia bacterium]